jgi:lysine-N-methylase
LLAKTESFGPAWDEALKRIKARLDSAENSEQGIEDEGFFDESESVRLLAYLIYRHYAKCLFEGREHGKLMFALFFWNAARFFTRELAGSTSADAQTIKINAVKILSRQLEYAEEIMEFVEISLDD